MTTMGAWLVIHASVYETSLLWYTESNGKKVSKMEDFKLYDFSYNWNYNNNIHKVYKKWFSLENGRACITFILH